MQLKLNKEVVLVGSENTECIIWEGETSAAGGFPDLGNWCSRSVSVGFTRTRVRLVTGEGWILEDSVLYQNLLNEWFQLLAELNPPVIDC
ncbi:hypothetical protein BZZ01_10630 [Nostocales cyanobacterium HT-58-2]|nr:hypothetical protein BZZ01_10630 [Nostocales cyanobacterium HT-58-2]